MSIRISNNIKNIAMDTFLSCENLRSVIIPDGVRSIGDNAFYGCDQLKTIDFPASVDYIGHRAFSDTPWYKEFEDEFVIVNNILLGYLGYNQTFKIPEGITSIASNDDYSGDIISIIIPTSVTYIGQGFFSGMSDRLYFFEGNAPEIIFENFDFSEEDFNEFHNEVMAYHLADTTGWDNSLWKYIGTKVYENHNGFFKLESGHDEKYFQSLYTIDNPQDVSEWLAMPETQGQEVNSWFIVDGYANWDDGWKDKIYYPGTYYPREYVLGDEMYDAD